MNSSLLLKPLLAIAISFSISANQAHSATQKDLVYVPNNHNEEIQLTIAVDKSTVKVDDYVSFYVTANQEGYVTIWDIGTSGKVQRLFPNKGSHDMQVAAGVKYGYGGAGSAYRFRVAAPLGFENVYAVWTEQAGLQPKEFDYASARGLAKDLQLVEKQDRATWATAHVEFEIIASSGSTYQQPKPPPNQARVDGQVYLLTMGSNVGQLAKTNDDARAFEESMRALFGSRLVSQFHADVTRAQMESGMTWLRNSVSPNDHAIIFYSGHGSFVKDDNGDEEDGYDEVFIPYDVEKYGADEEYVVRDDLFASWVNAIGTNNILTVIDACHGGGLPKSMFFNGRAKRFKGGNIGVKSKGLTNSNRVDDITDGVKGLTLAAAQEDELAMEVAEGGLFVRSFLNALGSGKSGTLLDYFYDAVEKTKSETRGRQNPIAIGDTSIASNIRVSN